MKDFKRTLSKDSILDKDILDEELIAVQIVKESSFKRFSSKRGTVFDDIPKWYGVNIPFELAITGPAFDYL